MLKVRKGSGAEIPLIQGKEQWLCFAGAAVKRCTTPKVKKTQERWYQRIYVHSSNGERDLKNRLLDTRRREERVRCMERVTWKLALPYVK